MIDSTDLVIPVYLNQRVVFDLVAVLQDGIASVTQVSKIQSEAKSESSQIGASFGLSNALSTLLRINLTGKQDEKSTVTRSVKESEGSISLNRKSAFNRLPSSALNQFKMALQSSQLKEMALPELEWEIKGPAIQVLPIAIFA